MAVDPAVQRRGYGVVLFDAAVPGQSERAHRLSEAILGLCLARGGSLTGEHGIGVDKRAQMGQMFTEDDLDTMQRLRCAFDPTGLANPGKVFPTPRLCGEAPLPTARRAVAGIGEVF